MIKLNDFARQMGVTDRAIQKHLAKYADKLEGLYQRKGPNGTWLTEEACDILRSKMRQAPAAIVEPDERVGPLLTRIADLEKRLDMKDAMLTAAQKTAQEAQNKAQGLLEAADKVKRLEAAQEAAEQEKRLLEGFVADAKAEIAALNEEKAQAEEAAQTANKDAQRARDELTAAHDRELELREYLAALDAWSALSGWKRRKKKKYPRPIAPEWLKEEE